ncbi:MAG: SMC family ATPase, partial [Acidobacteriota bacterium]
MHICKVELENIKSHAESTFEFSRGTTVISGENGAGKTTIIEAVAWTLFDLLDYKKEDFVRRGAKKGIARVTIESGLDERLYTVYRDTGTGYYVYDPALKTRIADKKEEVCRFLWQHLGVEAGTDLDSLFRRAIGVPQGTFTAIFLESPAERKRAFDKLLKVEEYRRGSDELLKTSRFIGQQITDASVGIARYEGELGRFEAVENECRIAAERVAEFSSKVEKTNVAIAAGTAVVDAFDLKETQFSDARARRDAAMSAHEQGKLVAAHRSAEAERARTAAEAVNSSRQDAERYDAAIARLRELERERVERERLRLEAAKVDTAEASVRSEKKIAAERLVNALNAHAAAASLTEAAAEQSKLETDVLAIRSRIAELKASGTQLASIDDKIVRLREAYRANQSQINEIETGIKNAGDLDGLQKRDAEIIRELARLQASLDRDAAFQQEILNGLCPILSARCLNLKEGETLEAFITSQFTELRVSIVSLETEQNSLGAALKLSQEAEKLSARLITLKERETEIREEGTRLKDERETLVSQTAELPELESSLAVAVATLARLDDPAGKIKLYVAESAREGEYREAISKIEKNLERLESDRLIIIEQLESFKDLDQHFAETSAVRDATESVHRIYIANADIAATLETCEAALS